MRSKRGGFGHGTPRRPGQITEIRTQIARNETFRGYRAATVGLSGLLALAGAAAQARWLPQPATTYGLPGVVVRPGGGQPGGGRGGNGRPLVLVCFAPGPAVDPAGRRAVCASLVAGGLLTATLVLTAPESAWLLPGLWAVVFSLGAASCRLLPAMTFLIGVYYLVGGIAALALARGEAAFSPWAMAGGPADRSTSTYSTPPTSNARRATPTTPATSPSVASTTPGRTRTAIGLYPSVMRPPARQEASAKTESAGG